MHLAADYDDYERNGVIYNLLSNSLKWKANGDLTMLLDAISMQAVMHNKLPDLQLSLLHMCSYSKPCLYTKTVVFEYLGGYKNTWLSDHSHVSTSQMMVACARTNSVELAIDLVQYRPWYQIIKALDTPAVKQNTRLHNTATTLLNACMTLVTTSKKFLNENRV